MKPKLKKGLIINIHFHPFISIEQSKPPSQYVMLIPIAAASTAIKNLLTIGRATANSWWLMVWYSPSGPSFQYKRSKIEGSLEIVPTWVFPVVRVSSWIVPSTLYWVLALILLRGSSLTIICAPRTYVSWPSWAWRHLSSWKVPKASKYLPLLDLPLGVPPQQYYYRGLVP